MGELFNELKRRNVVRVAVAYAVIGWLIIEVIDTIAPRLGLPEWVPTFFIVLVIAGLPLALFFSWAYELTPQGVKKTHEVDADASITPSTGRRLDFIIIGALVLALGYFVWDKFGAEGPGGELVKRAEASIAVLPFANMSPDPEQEYFSDGISEELLNLLVKVEGLKVAGRTSSFAFKGKDVDLREIGEALGVAHVLEGSVRREANKVRITAQLIRSSDGFHIWSETYDRELVSVFAIQDEIAAAIVNALRETLVGNTENTLVKAGAIVAPVAPRADIAAYDLYLLAQSKAKKRSTGSLTEAKTYLERALAQDPDYVPALTAMAENFILLSDYRSAYGDIPIKEAYSEAKGLINRALTLDPGFARGHAVLGLAELANGNLAAAEAALSRARAMDGQLVEAVIWLSIVKFTQGDIDAGQALGAQAAALEPLWALPVGNVASQLTAAGRLSEARQLIDRIKKYQPDNPVVLAREADLLDRERREADAVRLRLRNLEANPRNLPSAAHLFSDYLALLAPEAARPFSQSSIHADYLLLTAGPDPALAHEIERLGAFPGIPDEDWNLAGREARAGHHQRVVALMDPYLAAISDGTSVALFEDNSAVFRYALALRAVDRDEDADAVVAAMKANLERPAWASFSAAARAGWRALLALLEGRDDDFLEYLKQGTEGGFIGIRDIIDPQLARFYADPRFRAIAGEMLAHINEERAKLGLGPADPEYLPWVLPAD